MNRRYVGRKVAARVVSDLCTIAVIAVTWWQITARHVTVPTALAALWQLSMRMQLVGAMLNGVGESVLYLADLTFFDRDAPEAQAALRGDARFAGLAARGLNFRYPGAALDALYDVDIAIRPGEIVALVGANGSGKTTLAKILAGLYRPDDGDLRHGDHLVADPEELRQVAAVVFQDFVRYRTSALDNVTFGRPEDPAHQDRARWAAEQLGLDEVLDRLPQGWATPLSREFTAGSELSGGQWQRLALARAFYRNALFVILDEPTAALDPDAEAALLASVRSLFAGRSVLLISHRFSGVRQADNIYVLDGGRVIESGSHDDLLALDGSYARMFLLQAKAYQDVK